MVARRSRSKLGIGIPRLRSEQAPQSLSEIPYSNCNRSRIRNKIATPSVRNDMGVITQFHKHIKCHPSIWTMRVFSNCHAELVSASPETLKQVQGDKEESIIKQPWD